MKKQILIANFVLLTNFVFAQKQYHFTQKVYPNSEYTMQNNSVVNGEIKFSGNPDVLEQMKKSGQKNPMTMKTTSYSEVKTVTQKETQKNIPFELTFTKSKTDVEMNGQKTDSPNPFLNTKIIGSYENGSHMKIEKIEGNLDENTKKMLMDMTAQMQTEVNFPNEGLNIGDSFTNKNPMKMPIPNVGEMNMTINTTYTLKKVENNEAYFDVDQDFVMNSDSSQMNLDASGKGTGKSIFSIDKNLFSNMDSDVKMQMKIKMPNNMTMENTSNVHSTVVNTKTK